MSPERRARWRDLPSEAGVVQFSDAALVVQTQRRFRIISVGSRSISFPAFGLLTIPVLRAAVFRSGSHVVLMSEFLDGGTRSVTFTLFTTSGASEPLTLGPFGGIPAGVPINLADGRAGQLVLFWHDTNTTGVGKTARVMRTDITYPGSDALVVNTDRTRGSNLVFCRLTGATRTLALFHNAALAGADGLNTAQARLLNQEEITAGTLSINPNTLRFSDTVLRRTADIRNAGRDMLEIRGISGGNAMLVDVLPSIPLPTCLAPKTSMQIVFQRGPNDAAAEIRYLVASVPALTEMTEAQILVQLDSIAGAKIDVVPTSICWVPGDTTPRQVKIIHRGGIPLRIAVTAPTQGFAWTSTQLMSNMMRTFNPGSVIVLNITPPVATATSTLSVTATDVDGNAIRNSPFTISLRSGCLAKVDPGDLRIGTWMADPAGPDLVPEGEFIELDNVSGRDLDMSSVVITELVFTGTNPDQPPGVGTETDFFAFSTTTLNGRAILPAGRTVRVLTRASVPADPPPFPATGPWRVFAGRSQGVWNNTGDTARIYNREAARVLLDTKRYVPANNLPRHRVPGFPRRIILSPNFQWSGTLVGVEDGDFVTVRDITGMMSLAAWQRSWGPEGQPGPVAPLEDPSYPAPGRPVGALIARWRQGSSTSLPLMIGTGYSFTIRDMNESGSPLMVDFGVNDGDLSDNSGFFDMNVDVFRL